MVNATANTSLHSWSTANMFKRQFEHEQHEDMTFDQVKFFRETTPFLTGYNTQNATQLLTLKKAMLHEWATYKTADQFVRMFLLANVSPYSFGIIGEMFFKQAALIPSYTSAMEKQYKKDPMYTTINNNLKALLQLTGDSVSSIDNMTSWLAMMSITRVLHGYTFSMTRFSMKHTFLPINASEFEKFTTRGATPMRVTPGTVLGINEDLYVSPCNQPFRHQSSSTIL